MGGSQTTFDLETKQVLFETGVNDAKGPIRAAISTYQVERIAKKITGQELIYTRKDLEALTAWFEEAVQLLLKENGDNPSYAAGVQCLLDAAQEALKKFFTEFENKLLDTQWIQAMQDVINQLSVEFPKTF